jgi:hypothetical protein
MLRFLDPQKLAILDHVLSQHLGIPKTGVGYVDFVAQCKHNAAQLNKQGIANPIRNECGWFASDVEAAFFAKIQGI